MFEDFQIGDAGHLFVILAFVTSIISIYSNFKAATSDEVHKKGWLKFSRNVWYTHSASVLGIIICLYIIIAGHHYEYHYAYDHSSNLLPKEFVISCFWEGQEGSFLLWIFWNVVLGNVLLRTAGNWKPRVLTVFSLVQVFLTSMILGVSFGDIKLGSSPFIMLTEMGDWQDFFSRNPGFIHEDGQGLNKLLQNYWMVIHPPVLFLGFASSTVPFAYAVSGLLDKKHSEWVRPSMPWMTFAVGILGVGIMMGAYWAYETLNFGGYWNWDPVENAVYVPWIILVAAMHAMTMHIKGKQGLQLAVILVVMGFLTVLYSTYLTRSGDLGDASVHSFTDLGLKWQLRIFILFFIIFSLVIGFRAKVPSGAKENKAYNGEFWLFIGIAALGVAAFQVLAIITMQAFGFAIKNQIPLYSTLQGWMAVVIALLSGVAQHFWWKKVGLEQFKKLKRGFFLIFGGCLIVAIALVYLMHENNGLFQSKESLWGTGNSAFILDLLLYTFLITAPLFTVISNSFVLVNAIKGKFNLSGGAIAHIGIGIMLLGILFSSGYSNNVSDNDGHRPYLPQEAFTRLSDKSTRLWLNRAVTSDKYLLVYKGARVKSPVYPEYIDKYDLQIIEDTNQAICYSDLRIDEKVVHNAGDTIEIEMDKEYHQIDFWQAGEFQFSLFPTSQVNMTMGGMTAAPDIKHFLSSDLYTHVNAVKITEGDEIWDDYGSFILSRKDSASVFKDYSFSLITIGINQDTLPGVFMKEGDNVVEAVLSVTRLSTQKEYVARPKFIIRKDYNVPINVPEFIPDAGIEISFTGVNPQKEEFAFSLKLRERDYIDYRIIRKPLVSLVWIGTIIMFVGVSISMRRRIKENRTKV